MLHCYSMEYEKASEVLTTLLNKQTLTTEEKEAVRAALGLLSLTVISKKAQKLPA